MSEPRSVPSPTYREAFLRELNRIERRNWQDRIFYLPSDIRVWMNATAPGETYSNVVRLVSSVYDGDGFPKISADQCAHYLLVLAALLHPDVNCGNLIHIFTQCNLSDNFLSLPDATNIYNSIVEDLEAERPLLPSNYKQHDYHAVIRAFDKVRWAFCPATLQLHMNTSFPSGPCILPFFHGEVINKKGGTANVHHYKIQEDLVESDELKKALAFSKHQDPNFGWCFEFAVKSYFPGWEDTYKFESEAFRGVRNHEGVVKYLGEYHFREKGDTSPTHHIILEYGQRDLDEYLADTYPPVLNTEIIAFWEGLFKVADTLKRLHQLKYKGEDGRIQHFKGWHGDIKPDNILRMREEFKLADFGFTKFEKDEIGKSSTFILGGTRTYGAPECDHRRLETTTPHLQTIDTWSFGCVLSAVATWVILGSQAYDNYRQVRMLEILELRQRFKDGKGGSAPSGDDAFHDGVKVLPSVLHWHDFLRNSSRKSDTISCRVLDLIEEKMLLERPGDRLSFEQLCQRLEDIILLARNDHNKSLDRGLLIQLKKVAPDTLKALLQLDKRAPATATPIVEVSTAQIVSPNTIDGQDSGSLLPNSRGQSQLRPLSDRVKKSERLKIVVGKTANREEAIKQDLGIGIMPKTYGICESPQQHPVDADQGSSRVLPLARNGVYPTTSSAKGKETEIPLIHLSNGSPVAAHGRGSLLASVDERSSSKKQIQQPQKSFHPPINIADANTFYDTDTMLPAQPRLQRKLSEEKSIEIRGKNEVYERGDGRTPSIPGYQLQTPITPPQVSRTPAGQRIIETSGPPAQLYGQQPSANPILTLPPSPQMSPETVPGHDAGRHPHIQIGHPTSTLPLTSYAIFQEHANLENLWGNRRGTFSALLGKIPEDPWLKKFISNRDIVFVVDNAATMLPHWAVATEVLVTLAMKIGPLDKDGLDLVYTIGHEHDVHGVKGWDIPTKFKHSMQRASQEIDARYNTNMGQTLREIFDGYRNIHKKMTLIILTDGLWKGCVSEDDVEKLIASFITNLNSKLMKWESRWFSIQFVSFGEHENALRRLKNLDDNMPIDDDVIDAKPWWYPEVDKLILGSMTDEGDKDGVPSLSPSPRLSRPSTSASHHTLPLPERTPSTRRHNRFSSLFK